MTEPELPDPEAKVARLLKAAAQTERAPASLRAEIDALRVRAGTGAPAHVRRRWWLPPLPAVGLRYASAATTAAAALVVGLVLALSGGGGLSIASAASLATRGPSQPAPALDASAPKTLLSARVGDLHFPNWETPQGWRSTGQRMDRVDGRAVTTVYYAKDGHRVAYSIVSAPALGGLNTKGEPYATLHQHGRTVVVWQERGHTCVLSATGISAHSLWKLAVSHKSAPI